MDIRRGDIYLSVDLSGGRGSEQGGSRPCVVVSNNLCNHFSPVVTVVPITSQLTKNAIPTHLELDKDLYRFKDKSIALAEQVTSIDKSRLQGKHIKSLTHDDMLKLSKCLAIQLDIQLEGDE